MRKKKINCKGNSIYLRTCSICCCCCAMFLGWGGESGINIRRNDVKWNVLENMCSIWESICGYIYANASQYPFSTLLSFESRNLTLSYDCVGWQGLRNFLHIDIISFLFSFPFLSFAFSNHTFLTLWKRHSIQFHYPANKPKSTIKEDKSTRNRTKKQLPEFCYKFRIRYIWINKNEELKWNKCATHVLLLLSFFFDVFLSQMRCVPAYQDQEKQRSSSQRCTINFSSSFS